jgi:cytoskeletal protein CcmA (bactofilin family)
MWRKEDGSTQASSEPTGVAVNSTNGRTGSIGGSISSALDLSPHAAACVSHGIRIKGELNGTEDLFVDGNVDGKITLGNATLTVGPNATVKAEISARDLVVRGRVEGKLTANEKIQIWNTARVEGDMKAERISIEEGAELHGKLEAGRPSRTGLAVGNAETLKRTESDKSKDPGSGEEKNTPGAAVAGAD